MLAESAVAPASTTEPPDCSPSPYADRAALPVLWFLPRKHTRLLATSPEGGCLVTVTMTLLPVRTVNNVTVTLCHS